jgi:hypothetical protein
MAAERTIEQNAADYIAGVQAWRKQVEDDLRAPDSWLSLTGLYDLKEGDNTVGSHPASDVVLPASAPAHLGTIAFHGGKARLIVAADSPVQVQVDGAPAREADLYDSANGARVPTTVTLGNITFFVHRYGDTYAIRVKDSANPAIREFKGRIWFEVNPDYRVRARFVPHAAPQAVRVDSVANATFTYASAGVVEFELHGRLLRLALTGETSAAPDGPVRRASALFRDATAGKETYSAVREVGVLIDAAGNAEVDFNRARNMPCAFTPYATCPLPPRENILDVRIEAGERYDNGNSHSP